MSSVITVRFVLYKNKDHFHISHYYKNGMLSISKSNQILRYLRTHLWNL